MAATEFGCVASVTSHTCRTQTPIQCELRDRMHGVSVLAMALGAAFFGARVGSTSGCGEPGAALHA